jgi:hypothetical protein
VNRLIGCLFLFLSFSTYGVCLKPEVAEMFSCKQVSSQLEASQKWCDDKFGEGFQAYRTTRTCSRKLQREYLNYTPVVAEPVVPVAPIIPLIVETNWTLEYKKEVKVSCAEEETSFCVSLCNNETECLLEEGMCKDCVGTSIHMTDFFRGIGNNIVPLNSLLTDHLLRRLESGDFVTFTSKTIYNLLTALDSKKIKRQFRALCTDETEYPVVFAKVSPLRREIINIDLVLCNNGLFQIGKDYGVTKEYQYTDTLN